MGHLQREWTEGVCAVGVWSRSTRAAPGGITLPFDLLTWLLGGGGGGCNFFFWRGKTLFSTFDITYKHALALHHSSLAGGIIAATGGLPSPRPWKTWSSTRGVSLRQVRAHRKKKRKPGHHFRGPTSTVSPRRLMSIHHGSNGGAGESTQVLGRPEFSSPIAVWIRDSWTPCALLRKACEIEIL